jgi:hypothetical protein
LRFRVRLLLSTESITLLDKEAQSAVSTVVAFTMKSFAFLLALIAALSIADAFFANNKVALTSSSLQMTLLTYGSKKMDFKPGSPLKNACAALGVQPKYSCKK